MYIYGMKITSNNYSELTSFNRFILLSIEVFIFMRAFGSLYTFIVGVASLTPLFKDPVWLISYEILDDIVFTVRDFLEALYFAYLFYHQSATLHYDSYKAIGIKGLAVDDLPIATEQLMAE
jgi:hypothetical protein